MNILIKGKEINKYILTKKILGPVGFTAKCVSNICGSIITYPVQTLLENTGRKDTFNLFWGASVTLIPVLDNNMTRNENYKLSPMNINVEIINKITANQ